MATFHVYQKSVSWFEAVLLFGGHHHRGYFFDGKYLDLELGLGSEGLL